MTVPCAPRPPSPAPSVLSITLAEFLDANIPTSTPIPSEIDAESLHGDFDEFSLTSADSDDSNDLNKTIMEYKNTPTIVPCPNPFLPPLVRIDADEVFGDLDSEFLESLEATLKSECEGSKGEKSDESSGNKTILGVAGSLHGDNESFGGGSENGGALEGADEVFKGFNGFAGNPEGNHKGFESLKVAGGSSEDPAGGLGASETPRAGSESSGGAGGPLKVSGDALKDPEAAAGASLEDSGKAGAAFGGANACASYEAELNPELVNGTAESSEASEDTFKADDHSKLDDSFQSFQDSDDEASHQEFFDYSNLEEEAFLEFSSFRASPPPLYLADNFQSSTVDQNNSNHSQQFFEDQDSFNASDNISFSSGSTSSSASSQHQTNLRRLSNDSEYSQYSNENILNYQPDNSLEALSVFAEDEVTASVTDNDEAETKKKVLNLMDDHDDFFFTSYPPVVRDATFTLKNQNIPHNEPFVFYLTEVYSPVRFWFHYENEVEKMMKELQDDYKDLKANDLVISDKNIVQGLLIACYYPCSREWSRAQIINPPNQEGNVRLIFVDYGTVGTFSKKAIKYLFERYLVYPRFANRGSLSDLIPNGEDFSWSVVQVDKFLSKFSDKKLKAKVLRKVEADNSYELDVEQVKESGNTNLRDWILRNGLAQAFDPQPGDIKPFCYTIECFDALENNYPTLHEKSVMLKEGIDYNLLLETNFLMHIGDENVAVKKPGVLKILGNEKFKAVKKLHFV